MDLGKANEIAQLLANVATFLGIPIAVIAYLRDRRKDKAEREVETFTTLNDVYVDYLKLCFDHPQGSWYSHGEMDGRRLSPDEIRDYVLFEIMICSCESAYYLYRDQSTAFKRRQWEGWNKYIRDWCDTDWFQGHWSPEFTAYFDREFADHISGIMEEVRVQASARISTPDESPANKPLQPPSGMALGCYRGGTAVSQQRPDYSWLIDSRSRIQAVLLALHESVSSADKRDRLAQEPMDRDAFVLLMGAAFSLWRAAFLSHAEHMWPGILTHANKFLEILIADNAINYPQDRDTRDWSGGYYLANARYRLVRALDIMGLASSGLYHRSTKRTEGITR